MNTTELIEQLQELEEDAGGPVQVQVLMQNQKGHNTRFTLDQFDLTLDERDSGTSVLIDLS